MTNKDTNLICSVCNQKIVIDKWDKECRDCAVMNHSCPFKITTADIKKCRYHKVLGMMNKMSREEIEKRYGK